jgi:hypothetical protein
MLHRCLGVRDEQPCLKRQRKTRLPTRSAIGCCVSALPSYSSCSDLKSSHRAQAPIGSDSSTRWESANGSDTSPEPLKSSAVPWSHTQGLRALVWQFSQRPWPLHPPSTYSSFASPQTRSSPEGSVLGLLHFGGAGEEADRSSILNTRFLPLEECWRIVVNFETISHPRFASPVYSPSLCCPV